MASTQFFEEDEVCMVTEAAGLRYGLVTGSSEYFSSDEDDDYESSNYERLRKGTVRVSWHPDGQSQVVPEAELMLADRSLMPGDIVRRFILGEDSQRGYVTMSRIHCHLQVIGKPFVICDVDSRDLLPISSFNTQPGDVFLESWVGKVVNVSERVVLKFSDGARCEVTDEDTIGMLLDFTDVFDKQPKDTTFAPMVFYEGQVLKGDFESLQEVKWLKSTKNFNQASARKAHNREVIVFVEKVETLQLEVNWVCRGFSSSSSHQGAMNAGMQPPLRIIKGEDLERLKKLDCFEACNYQVGDRALYTLKESDRIVTFNLKDRHSVIHQVIRGDGGVKDSFRISVADNKTSKATKTLSSANSNEASDNIDNSRTDDVSEGSLEKHGGEVVSAEAVGASGPVPVRSVSASGVEASESQTKGAQEKKPKVGAKRVAAQVKQLKKKKLKPTKVKLQLPTMDQSPPNSGQKLPVELIYTSTVVDVVWQDGSKEVDIVSTDLLPVHHLDELEFFPGDYVVAVPELVMLGLYGVVQSVDHSGRTCRVKWLQPNSSSSEDTVVRVEEVSVYDIKDHPDHKFRAGHVVVQVGHEEQDLVEKSGVSNAQSSVGQVYELGCDGPMLIHWADGSQSSCYPRQLYLVGDELSDLYSDSEDSYSTEDECLSNESWEWETEEETQLPLEDNGVVNSIVESSNDTKELTYVISSLKEAMKRIEEFVAAMQTKGLTATSSGRFFRHLTHFFRLCRDFDQAAATSFFEDKELVAAMSGIKRLSKKNKAQQPNKQMSEVAESDKNELETGSCDQPERRNAVLQREESGNDSGLEKSPSNSELRGIELNNVSHSCDEYAALPTAKTPDAAALGRESSVGCCKLLNDVAIQTQAIDGLTTGVCVEENEIANKSVSLLESSVVNLAVMLGKICEQLERLGKVWFPQDGNDDKLCIKAVKLLAQAVSSNVENLSVIFRTTSLKVGETSSEEAFSCEASSETSCKNPNQAIIQNGSSTNCTTDNGAVLEGSIEDGSVEEKSVPGKGRGLELTFTDVQSDSISDLVETVSKTPLTPVEVRAKVMFNREGFTLVEMVPEFHHFQDQKHTPVDTKSFNSTIRKELKLLQSCLPNGIYVKGFESRMDLFSIMIEGPGRTPYEDGLFFFDVQLPNNYPASPPLFFYVSYCTDRLNPNLYEDGKVCVSLLGTWTGKGTEMWSSKSNLLQVLISIQGLILNPEPYYNEAGYERQKGTQLGYENSRMYNEMAIVKMVQSMTKIAVNPFQPFANEIQSHLKRHACRLVNRLRFWLALAEDSCPGKTVSEAEPSTANGPSSESKSCAAGCQTSSPSLKSDLNSEDKANGEACLLANSTSSKESLPLDLAANSDSVKSKEEPNGLRREESDLNSAKTCESCSQNSLFHLDLDTEGDISPPAFPLLPISKGFRLSLMKCLDSFESILNTVGISKH